MTDLRKTLARLRSAGGGAAFACVLAAFAAVAFAAVLPRHSPEPRPFVRFALCQTDAAAPAGADPVSAALSAAADAVSNGADVVVLPELSFLSFARLTSERSFPARA